MSATSGNNNNQDWDPTQKKMGRGALAGLVSGGIVGAGLSLTPVFTMLASTPGSSRQIFATVIMSAITGTIFGALIASPPLPSEETGAEAIAVPVQDTPQNGPLP